MDLAPNCGVTFLKHILRLLFNLLLIKGYI